MLENKTINQFIEELSSETPTPGGGSVTGLTASLAVALGSMVLNLTLDKKLHYIQTGETINKINDARKKCDKLQEQFKNFMNQDVEAFSQVMKAYKLPKNTKEEKELRKNKIQESYKLALEVPLNILEVVSQYYSIIYTLLELGNRNLIADTKISLIMITTTYESALVNFDTNLGYITDEDYKLNCIDMRNSLLSIILSKETNIMQKMFKINRKIETN